MRIMVVDDDKNILELVSIYLEKEGFEIIKEVDGAEALRDFKAAAPDLIVLDLMLPGLDGMSFCREVRSISDVPIIMLTAKGETFDKITGLESGADDYIVKPFEPKELVARVKAVLRRYEPKDSEEVVSYPGIMVNKTQYRLLVDGEEVKVAPKELELLYFLATHPNQVFTREQLLDTVWGYGFYGDSRTVDVHVKRLREKIPDTKVYALKTVWGVGYKFEVKP
ncbi:response regulator transcription factor [Calorimonas adulescens]|jgi:Transcriptional regulatory protein, C terminal./Response regulator receiver domain.|uniref:Stage 0 sporulation protein A homolog n=1 Tax=Calorimonas adulescens TaxID=2606906 RepID=A0A5D8QA89_9THEO|nr:response regulator transcription factor [Calorimonas adulescens]TZE81382.1 response regulator transcription factor [Calorimonas adulescens]